MVAGGSEPRGHLVTYSGPHPRRDSSSGGLEVTPAPWSSWLPWHRQSRAEFSLWEPPTAAAAAPPPPGICSHFKRSSLSVPLTPPDIYKHFGIFRVKQFHYKQNSISSFAPSPLRRGSDCLEPSELQLTEATRCLQTVFDSCLTCPKKHEKKRFPLGSTWHL